MAARRSSMKGDRRRAMIWSYVFLCIFVVFFLTPPVYMLITSLKTSAEISAAVSPWCGADPAGADREYGSNRGCADCCKKTRLTSS